MSTPKRRGDATDREVMEEWRPGRLQILGMMKASKLEPRERLGKLTCTLGAVREEGEGAAYSRSSQNWPEFRSAEGIMYQRAFMTMTVWRRKIMDARYTFSFEQGTYWADYYTIKVRADALDLSIASFWEEVNKLKAYLEGFKALDAALNDPKFNTPDTRNAYAMAL